MSFALSMVGTAVVLVLTHMKTNADDKLWARKDVLLSPPPSLSDPRSYIISREEIAE